MACVYVTRLRRLSNRSALVAAYSFLRNSRALGRDDQRIQILALSQADLQTLPLVTVDFDLGSEKRFVALQQQVSGCDLAAGPSHNVPDETIGASPYMSRLRQPNHAFSRGMQRKWNKEHKHN